MKLEKLKKIVRIRFQENQLIRSARNFERSYEVSCVSNT